MKKSEKCPQNRQFSKFSHSEMTHITSFGRTYFGPNFMRIGCIVSEFWRSTFEQYEIKQKSGQKFTRKSPIFQIFTLHQNGHMDLHQDLVWANFHETGTCSLCPTTCHIPIRWQKTQQNRKKFARKSPIFKIFTFCKNRHMDLHEDILCAKFHENGAYSLSPATCQISIRW